MASDAYVAVLIRIEMSRAYDPAYAAVRMTASPRVIMIVCS